MAQSLPKTFALYSAYNKKYLAYITDNVENHGLLKFSADDLSLLTKFEVEPAKTGDGLVHIKCAYNNKYWRRWSPNHWWIAGEADEPEEDKSQWSCTLFKPSFNIDGDPNAIRIVHVQLDHITCSWRAGEPYTYCLYAQGKDTDRDKLDVYTVTDLVPVSSQITDVKFDLTKAKIYGQTYVDLATGIAVNNVDDQPEEKSVTLDYIKNESSTWKGGSSSNSGVVTTVKSAIPVIFDETTTQVSGNQLTGSYEWGKTLESTIYVKTTYNVVVPPKTMVIVTLKATKASFDVPFSYTQVDTLANQQQLVLSINGGVYTGVHLFNFIYESTLKKRN